VSTDSRPTKEARFVGFENTSVNRCEFRTEMRPFARPVLLGSGVLAANGRDESGGQNAAIVDCPRPQLALLDEKCYQLDLPDRWFCSR
jgi:hypothetical protein